MTQENKTKTKTPVFGDKAQSELLNFRFNTQADRMLEMSILSGREAWAIAVMKTMNDHKQFTYDMAMHNLHPNDENFPKPEMFFLADRFVYYYLQAKRSTQDGRTLKDASDMTMASIEATVDSIDDEPYPGESA